MMHSSNGSFDETETQRKFFESLVKDYSPMLYAQIRGIVLNHDDADDVLQETFIKVWKALPTFRGEAAVSTWLYRIANNEALQHLRKQKWRKMLLMNVAHADVSVKASPSAEFISCHLEKALKQLTAHQRNIFALRYFNETPYSEIAELLHLAEGTVKATYHQSMKKIEAYLIDNS